MRNPAIGPNRRFMRTSRQNRREIDRGALPAILAALAMLVQLLIPAASMATEARVGQGPVIMLCTADGPVAMASDSMPDHGKGFAGFKCHDCVMTSVAAIGSATPLMLPVRYASRIEALPAGHERPQARSRGPPRPPSTAPPVSLNA